VVPLAPVLPVVPAPPLAPVGKTEKGFWTASAAAKPEGVPNETSRAISYVIAAAKLTAPVAGCPGVATCHAKQISELETKEIAEGKKGMAGCKAVAAADPNLLEEPVAESGNLCAYTGTESKIDMAPTGVRNVLGESGSSAGGALIGYEIVNVLEASETARGQGTYAVTG
jgi:hypothetical protein